MTDDFARLSPPDQKRKLQKARAEADWAAASGPMGGVIRHLRDRALATRRTAGVFLVMLVVTVLVGLVFYLGLPFWQTWADGREGTLKETRDDAAARIAVLDSERVALLTGKMLDDGSIAPTFASLLSDTLVELPVEIRAPLSGGLKYEGRIYLYAQDGRIFSLEPDEHEVYELLNSSEAWFTGAIEYGGSLYIFGTSGTILRIGPDHQSLGSVYTGEFETINNAILFRDRLYFYGNGGLLLILSEDGASTERLESKIQGAISGAVTYNESLYLYGEAKSIARIDDFGSRIELLQSSEGAWPGYLGSATFAGSLYLYGDGGLLSRISGGSNKIEEFNSISTVMLNGSFVRNERMFIYGSEGAVLYIADGDADFKSVETSSKAWINGAILTDRRVLFYGSDGAILVSGENGQILTEIETHSEDWLRGTETLERRHFIYGANGIVLSVPIDGTEVKKLSTGTNAEILGGIVHGGRLYLYTAKGEIFVQPSELIALAGTLSTDPGEIGQREVSNFFLSLPSHVQNYPPLQDLDVKLRIVTAERAALSKIEADAKDDLARLQANPLQSLRNRKALDFDAFLNTCRGDTPTPELSTACLTAWQTEQTQSQRSWWEALTAQVPPGILLLFLLATLGGLYRYNLRLAGFHESRADFLTLMAYGRTEKELRDILAKTQTDAVNLATMVLAADKVEMGAIKAKLGQAEIELARTLSGVVEAEEKKGS